jgi:hypothetical protein
MAGNVGTAENRDNALRQKSLPKGENSGKAGNADGLGQSKMFVDEAQSAQHTILANCDDFIDIGQHGSQKKPGRELEPPCRRQSYSLSEFRRHAALGTRAALRVLLRRRLPPLWFSETSVGATRRFSGLAIEIVTTDERGVAEHRVDHAARFLNTLTDKRGVKPRPPDLLHRECSWGANEIAQSRLGSGSL